jgi:heme-degrading monooxygenase HmoA
VKTVRSALYGTGSFAGDAGREEAMIIRSWRAVAASEEVVKAYADHLERFTFEEMARLSGHIGACLSSKRDGDRFVLLVMSFWKDMDAVRQFSPGSVDDAVVKPSTQKLLEEFDLKVEHFEVLVKSGSVLGSSTE